MAGDSLAVAAVGAERSIALSRKKYLVLSPWPVKSGTGVNNVMVGLMSAMRECYEPAIIVTGWQQPPGGQGWIKLPIPNAGTRSLLSFAAHFLPTMWRLYRAARGAAAINPHYCGLEMLPLVALRKLRLAPKVILSVHGADVSEAAEAREFHQRLFRWLFENADLVIACSNKLASEVTEISPKANVVPVWNGVSQPGELGLRPMQAPYLVSVAAFVKKKGHDVLFEAFERLAVEFPLLHFVLIGGDGPERLVMEDRIHKSPWKDRVKVLVNLSHEEVWNWVHHAECFVHAPREEPFGIALLEAALVHTPVVTTRAGGIAEYLTDRVHGLSCEIDNAEQLAGAVRETLEDRPMARSRAHAFYAQARRFTWEAAWQRYRTTAGI